MERFPLNDTLSPLSSSERQKINENWQRIKSYFNSVQTQLNTFLGGDIEDLLDRIDSVLDSAETSAQQLAILISEVSQKIIQATNASNAANSAASSANTAASNANTARTNANNAAAAANSAANAANTAKVQADTARDEANQAAERANQAATDAESAYADALGIIEELESLQDALEALQISLNTLETNVQDAENVRETNEQERIDNETARVTKEEERQTEEGERLLAEEIREMQEQARVDAEVLRAAAEEVRETNEQERIDNETIRETNEQAREDAEALRQLLYDAMLALYNDMESHKYVNSETYNFPNFVLYNGSTYIALKEVTGITPNDDGVNWRLVAQRGVDGEGAVASVNGVLPDVDGNVELELTEIIDALTTERTDAALSAKQGKVLKGLIDALAQIVDDKASTESVTILQTALQNALQDHELSSIVSEEGVHGIRYFEETLSININGEWHEIKTGGGAIDVPDVSGFTGFSAVDGKSITVNWANPTNAEFKRVDLYVSNSDISNVKLEDIASVATKVLSGTDTTYAHPTNHGEQLYFKIFAVHEVIGDRFSSGLTINVVASDTKPPGNVTGIAVIPDDEKFTLNWVNPSDSDLNRVKVLMKTGSYPTSVSDGTVIYEGTGTSVTVDSLVNETNYYIRFFVSDVVGNVNDSTDMQVIAMPIGIKGVSDLTVGQNAPGTQFTLNWLNPTDATYVKTEVYASTSDLSSKSRAQCTSEASLIYDGTGQTATHTTTPGNTYYFKAFTEHNVAGVTRYDGGQSISLLAIDTEPPSPISSFVAVGKDGAVDLSWVNPSDTDFQKVIIRYKLGSYPTSSTDGQLAYDGSATSVSVSGLTNDETYYFRAFTVDVNGNVNSSTNGQQITATPSGAVDKTNAPGPKKLIAGTMEAGYFGTVPASEIYTGSEIALACGVTQGTLQHDTTPWLKFAYEGKILFRPMKAIRHSISWDHIHAQGCAYGSKTVSKNGVTYKVRLMKGSTVDPAIVANDATNTMKGSEWNKLMLPIHEQAATKAWAYPNYVEDDVPNWGIGFTDADLLTHNTHGNGSYIWCQETSASNSAHRVLRGRDGVSRATAATSSYTTATRGWAPVLEVSSL